jgi:Ca2+/Na+ antiporter
MNMSEDVVGATFMAAAVSCPDLFINVMGTFVTEGDIGVGTVVGSAIFNGLAVPAFCGLFAEQVQIILTYIFVEDGSLYY